MPGWQRLVLPAVALCALASGSAPAQPESPDDPAAEKLYQVVDGRVDARTYNGFRRYNAGCNHCHGPDGVGSSFGPPLIERLADLETFRRVILEGQGSGTSRMDGFADDPNIAPYIDDIYSYLQARADGVLGRGRPGRLEP